MRMTLGSRRLPLECGPPPSMESPFPGRPRSHALKDRIFCVSRF
jgi:hypothetical protein